MPGRLFIHATNVHQGGGQALLGALLGALQGKTRLVLSLDERMPVPVNIADDAQVNRVKPTVLQRFGAEKWLARIVASEDVVLCFGNLPPLFRLRGRVVVFVQNRYLIDDVKLEGFPVGVRLRISIERLWFSMKLSNASECIVQTPTMKRLLKISTGGRVPVRVLPFVAEPSDYVRSLPQRNAQNRNDYDFVYVASGEPHKNHHRLMEAWCLLAEEGYFPSLCLTLDEERFPELCRNVDLMRQRYSLKVVNVGCLSHQDVLELYRNADAAIYPSIFESFGLPLIEARQAGLPVLASELDYVRDVLDPEQTFDPGSSVSIAKAVRRFIGVSERTLPLLDGAGFIAALLDRAE